MPDTPVSLFSRNFILNFLPSVEFERLAPHLQPIELHQNEILVRSGQPMTEVYFPTAGLLSLTHATQEGDVVEVGAIGFEGTTGTILLLDQNTAPWQIEVQLGGGAVKLNTAKFSQLLADCPVLRQKIAEFTYLTLVQLTQSAVCNRFHPVEQRLCRWLLAASDRVQTDELLLTRDILAAMIGSRRPAVSLISGTLQAAGLIRATRGKITILNREEMEEASCECYAVIKQAFARYLQT